MVLLTNRGEILLALSPHVSRNLLKGEYIMAIVRHTRAVGTALTPDQLEEIEAASKRPYVYDPDCPLLTEEQLAEFHPVNGMTWEERARLMREPTA
jgi:hypothetical protein